MEMQQLASLFELAATHSAFQEAVSRDPIAAIESLGLALNDDERSAIGRIDWAMPILGIYFGTDAAAGDWGFQNKDLFCCEFTFELPEAAQKLAPEVVERDITQAMEGANALIENEGNRRQGRDQATESPSDERYATLLLLRGKDSSPREYIIQLGTTIAGNRDIAMEQPSLLLPSASVLSDNNSLQAKIYASSIYAPRTYRSPSPLATGQSLSSLVPTIHGIDLDNAKRKRSTDVIMGYPMRAEHLRAALAKDEGTVKRKVAVRDVWHLANRNDESKLFKYFHWLFMFMVDCGMLAWSVKLDRGTGDYTTCLVFADIDSRATIEGRNDVVGMNSVENRPPGTTVTSEGVYEFVHIVDGDKLA